MKEGDELITLKAARINANLSLKDVTNMLNINIKTLSSWERGMTAIPATMFFDLCKIYKLDSDLVAVPKVVDGKYNE